jgi:hypothetical protein
MNKGEGWSITPIILGLMLLGPSGLHINDYLEAVGCVLYLRNQSVNNDL